MTTDLAAMLMLDKELSAVVVRISSLLLVTGRVIIAGGFRMGGGVGFGRQLWQLQREISGSN